MDLQTTEWGANLYCYFTTSFMRLFVAHVLRAGKDLYRATTGWAWGFGFVVSYGFTCTTSKGYRGPIVTQITTSNETMSENNDQLSGERKWLSYQDNGSGVNLWNVCLRNELGAIGQNFTAMDTKIAASHYDIMGILDVIKGASVKSTVMRVGQNLVVVGGSLSQNQWF